MRPYQWRMLLIALIVTACPIPASAEDKSIFSPIIHVDKGKGYIVVSSDGKVFAVEVDEAAKPHLEQLPVSGMIDMVVELRPGTTPLLKKWKVAGGESACKEFDGKNCK
ncbi:MAG TPA: hypothetical protein VJ692_15790 [Nitrospiraceae bacterium]|nr:hypothetical protein [Nitrospiraceae bacterium]